MNRTTGRKRYDTALCLFLTALTAPTAVVNAITVACYKKYVLVSLLHKGAPVLPPLLLEVPVHQLAPPQQA